MAANYQQGYTSPETEDILRGVPQQQDHGLWDVIGRAIHSLVPERPSDPAVGPPDAKQPFQPAGFFRSLLGDKSNELNLAARTGQQDRGIARGLATDQVGADIASEKRALADDSTMLARRGAMERVNEDNRSVNSLRNALTTGQVDQGYAQNNLGLGEQYKSRAAALAAKREADAAAVAHQNRMAENAVPKPNTPEEVARIKAETGLATKRASGIFNWDNVDTGAEAQPSGPPPGFVPQRTPPPSAPPPDAQTPGNPNTPTPAPVPTATTAPSQILPAAYARPLSSERSWGGAQMNMIDPILRLLQEQDKYRGSLRPQAGQPFAK